MSSLAKLEVSKCHRFAFLYNSEGDYFVIWSKPFGLYMVESGVKHSIITEEDAKSLVSQINSSELPDDDNLVEINVKTALRNLNQAHVVVAGYELDEEMVAEAIDFLEGANRAKPN